MSGTTAANANKGSKTEKKTPSQSKKATLAKAVIKEVQAASEMTEVNEPLAADAPEQTSDSASEMEAKPSLGGNAP